MHQPTDSQDINRRVLTISTVLIAFIMGAAALHWLRPVMIPFILALFFAYLLAPIIDWIEQRGVNRWLAIFVVFFVDLIGFILFFGLVSSSFKELSEDFPVHLERFKRFMDYSIDFFNKNGVNVGIDTLKQHIFELPFTKIVMGMTNTILKLLSNTFLILIFMVYLLMKPNPKPREGSIRAEIDHRIKRYIIIKVSLSAVTGILVALILSALRVDLAIFFGLMAFVLNFIPS
ncbi:AI-2E family transporter, partial [Myxococcota bacterium]|nr:AI-2E family transporter [Myxococcota bacterium]